VVPPRASRPTVATAGLASIREEDSEGDSDDSDALGEENSKLLNEVPQCFSHFTHTRMGGKILVCDIQGVWNKVDGFTLTDPAFHSTTHRHKYGRTDKGKDGIRTFFETHTCGNLCTLLGLENPLLK
jgi:hypothetical protein